VSRKRRSNKRKKENEKINEKENEKETEKEKEKREYKKIHSVAILGCLVCLAKSKISFPCVSSLVLPNLTLVVAQFFFFSVKSKLWLVGFVVLDYCCYLRAWLAGFDRFKGRALRGWVAPRLTALFFGGDVSCLFLQRAYIIFSHSFMTQMCSIASFIYF